MGRRWEGCDARMWLSEAVGVDPCDARPSKVAPPRGPAFAADACSTGRASLGLQCSPPSTMALLHPAALAFHIGDAKTSVATAVDLCDDAKPLQQIIGQ